MNKTMALSDLNAVKVYRDRAEYFTVTGQHAPRYNPSLPLKRWADGGIPPTYMRADMRAQDASRVITAYTLPPGLRPEEPNFPGEDLVVYSPPKVTGLHNGVPEDATFLALDAMEAAVLASEIIMDVGEAAEKGNDDSLRYVTFSVTPDHDWTTPEISGADHGDIRRVYNLISTDGTYQTNAGQLSATRNRKQTGGVGQPGHWVFYADSRGLQWISEWVAAPNDPVNTDEVPVPINPIPAGYAVAPSGNPMAPWQLALGGVGDGTPVPAAGGGIDAASLALLLQGARDAASIRKYFRVPDGGGQ